MLQSGPAARLTIYVAIHALKRHMPVYTEIVHRAHREGLPGASVFYGLLGYGAAMRIHEDRPSRLSAHGPCTVVIIGDEQRLRAFLTGLEDLLPLSGIAVLDRVEVYRPAGR